MKLSFVLMLCLLFQGFSMPKAQAKEPVAAAVFIFSALGVTLAAVAAGGKKGPPPTNHNGPINYSKGSRTSRLKGGGRATMVLLALAAGTKYLSSQKSAGIDRGERSVVSKDRILSSNSILRSSAGIQ